MWWFGFSAARLWWLSTGGRRVISKSVLADCSSSVKLIPPVLMSAPLCLNSCKLWAKRRVRVCLIWLTSSPSSDFSTFTCPRYSVSVRNWLHTSTFAYVTWAKPDTGNASTWGDMRPGDEMRGVMYLSQRIGCAHYSLQFWSNISFTRFLPFIQYTISTHRVPFLQLIYTLELYPEVTPSGCWVAVTGEQEPDCSHTRQSLLE